MLTAILLGFALGLRHAFDPDHVIAVSAVAARHRSAWTASWVGMSWGLGHGATLLAVGFLVIALRIAVPETLARSLEIGVGALLVALGVSNLASLRAADGPAAGGGDTTLRAALTRSGCVGVVHGLAGSGAVALLALAAMPSAQAALLYLFAFGIGTIAGMMAFTLALSAPLAVFGDAGAFRRLTTAATGAISLLFGAYLIHAVGSRGATPF